MDIPPPMPAIANLAMVAIIGQSIALAPCEAKYNERPMPWKI